MAELVSQKNEEIVAENAETDNNNKKDDDDDDGSNNNDTNNANNKRRHRRNLSLQVGAKRRGEIYTPRIICIC